ncbi:amino acid ABC transporter permease [Mesorhizobium sp. M4A.F.Ca.ET.020.02.1.1]|uniref:amino acid ABC transporter permease n=2 Tax=Mesorhizobium TaxID=68287 RepID=UPI000FCA73AD|nr:MULTISPECIES: amino acid ABC transporter permease [unclassified Mesorhizobium]RUX50021.1 amino acid ABC transporter permease [Mesorhizobium sp. M4A.F.Ca.ET.050.02.1.1]RVD43930.1 amino acid ABC transporter permease [Mesorhizobium sp. M4A.F.Ca.ET.020.02.1.1]RWC19221.1 MAG: amino acid ABC transporter permease [Mesorhizobium sp.]RWD28115.1 MAG: amino acid ABC transporter permease [Mesorhizobium sp.]TIT67452.1 MAG: ABC transporter permease subunit [Mesorhizobium sp.]
MELIDTFFNWSILVRSFPILIRGLGNTILLGCAAIVFGTIAGLAICLMRLYAPKPLRRLAILYIDIFRALPILVVLILIYYALPFVGIRLSSFVSAALALSLVLAAFTAEVCRAGIENIPKGQFEAAAALGLPFWVAMRKVILPQAIRVVIPPLTSNCVSVFKDTALASVVAMPDLLKQATDAQALMANPTPLIGAAIIYLAFLWPLVRLVGYLEERGKAQSSAH